MKPKPSIDSKALNKIRVQLGRFRPWTTPETMTRILNKCILIANEAHEKTQAQGAKP